MGEVVVFQHDPFEDLGFFAEVLEKLGTAYRVVRLFHDELPKEDWDYVRALIVLGGSDGVADESEPSLLRWEKRIIRAAIDESVPTLGVGTGAQLIAAALDAAVYCGAVREIGWSPIAITPHGQVDSLLGYLPENATVFQWHGSGFELPVGAVRLASSVHYPTQAFRVGRSVYALQFHLEMTPRMIERWLDERSKDLALAAYASAEKIISDTHKHAETLKYYGERFLSEFLRRSNRGDLRKPNKASLVHDTKQ